MGYQSNGTSGRGGYRYNGRGMSERSHMGRVSMRSEEISGAARANRASATSRIEADYSLEEEDLGYQDASTARSARGASRTGRASRSDGADRSDRASRSARPGRDSARSGCASSSMSRLGRNVYRIDDVDDDYMSEFASGYAEEEADAPRRGRRHPHRRERLRSDIDRLSSRDRRGARTSAATWHSAGSSWGKPRPSFSLKKVIIGVAVIAVLVFAVTKLTGCMG